MFVTKKSLRRRTFLRGVGAGIALPLLDAMVPALTPIVKTAALPTRRFGFVYVAHGALMDYWTPAEEGQNFQFTPVLKSLEPFRERVTIVTNLTRPTGPIDNHAQAASGWMNGIVPKRTEAEDVEAAVTVDQIIAGEIGRETPFPSLEIATEDFSGYVGGCVPGASCTYLNTISWKNATTPLPMEINPRALFERLLGQPGTARQRRARMQENRSILDSLLADANDLRQGLGARDQTKLAEYLDNIREIEQRIQRIETLNTTNVTTPDAPVGIPESFEEHVALMFDLMMVAWEADLTRVLTFMMTRELSARTYPDLGVTEPHHPLSHHQNNPDKLAGLVKIQTYQMAQFAKFVEKLSKRADGDGTLLDNVTMFYGAGMADSNAHAPTPLPMVIVGGGAGTMKGNRHLVLPAGTPKANLWVNVAQSVGAKVDQMGNSTGPISL